MNDQKQEPKMPGRHGAPTWGAFWRGRYARMSLVFALCFAFFALVDWVLALADVSVYRAILGTVETIVAAMAFHWSKQWRKAA